jgi:plasmid stabilization system protein ParE
MAKQIIWSKIAQENRITILDFWNKRNASNNYSKKLNQIFKDSVALISKYPTIGKRTVYNDIRIKIVGHYFTTYRITTDKIEILTIWDSRQDPENFERIIKKV